MVWLIVAAAAVLVIVLEIHRRAAAPSTAARLGTNAPAAADVGDHLPDVDPKRLAELIKKHTEAMDEAGATGNPSDYVSDLIFLPGGPDLPVSGKLAWCGCCQAPFPADPKVGLWISKHKKSGKPAPICGVCIEFLNRSYEKQQGRRPLQVPAGYDPVGADLATRFEVNPPTKLAVIRLMLIEYRSKLAV